MMSAIARMEFTMIPLALSRVNVAAVHGDDGGVGAERLLVQLAGRVSVDGVGELRTELLDVEVFRAGADLLVGREADSDVAVEQFRIVDERLDGRHDDGNAGLVVRAEERGAVARDDCLADVLLQLGIFGFRDDYGRIAGQNDVAAPDIRSPAASRSLRWRRGMCRRAR